MDIYAALAAAAEAVPTTWVTLDGKFAGHEIKVAPAHNAEFRNFTRREFWSREVDFKRGIPDPGKAEPLVHEATALHILKDWRGFDDADGAPVEYQPGLAVKLFAADPEFYAAVIVAADAYSARLQAAEAASEKN